MVRAPPEMICDITLVGLHRSRPQIDADAEVGSDSSAVVGAYGVGWGQPLLVQIGEHLLGAV